MAFIDFGMMADIDEEDRYGLFGLVIGLQNKDLPLITENLLKVSRLSWLCKLYEARESHTEYVCPLAWFLGRYHSTKSARTATAGSIIELHRWNGQSIRRQFCPTSGRVGRNKPGKRTTIQNSPIFYDHSSKFDDP